MFARGPQPGDRPKERVQVMDPGAVCRKGRYDHYWVTLSCGREFNELNPPGAWRLAESWLARQRQAILSQFLA